jgi:hypothetical protein
MDPYTSRAQVQSAAHALADAAAHGDPPASVTHAFQAAYNEALAAEATSMLLRSDGVCDLKTQQAATDSSVHFPAARALLEAIAAVSSDPAAVASPTWWQAVQPQCLAFQQAFNGAVRAEWDASTINDQGIYDVRTATAVHRVLADAPSPATTTGATLNVHEAAHRLMAVIAQRPVPYLETLAFQQAWNRSGFPGSMGLPQRDGWPHLREDGDYGTRTTRALLTIQTFWLEQGDPTKQAATSYREPVAFEFGRPGTATTSAAGLPFVRFVTPADVADLVRQVDAGVQVIDAALGSVRSPSAAATALIAGSYRWREAWEQFMAHAPGWFDAAAQMDRAESYARQLGAWIDAFAKVGIVVPPPMSVTTSGFDLGQAFQDVAHGVEQVVAHPDKVIADVAHGVEQVVAHPDKAIADIGRALRPVADTFLSVAQGVVSLIPGIGTGISAALGAAQAVIDGGGPLEVAIRTAYGAIPIPIGLRSVTDPVVDAIIALAGHKSIEETALYVIRDRLPSGFPRDVFDTLAHVLEKAIPIVKSPDHVRQHMVNSFVHGPEHGVQQGMRRHVPPEVAAHLHRLPPMHARFPSVARPGVRGAIASVTLNADHRTAPAPPAPRVTGAPPTQPVPSQAAV